MRKIILVLVLVFSCSVAWGVDKCCDEFGKTHVHPEFAIIYQDHKCSTCFRMHYPERDIKFELLQEIDLLKARIAELEKDGKIIRDTINQNIDCIIKFKKSILGFVND
jgi:hypothetical protein